MMSAPTVDPVFEALGLSTRAIKGNDWMTNASAAHTVESFGAAPHPYAAAWPPAAWCMYAEAAAAAAAAATVNPMTPPAANTNGAPLLLPELLPAEKPKAPGTRTDATGQDAEVASAASTSPGSHQLWSSPLPWGNTTAWYSSSSSDALSTPVKGDALSASKNSSEATDSNIRDEADKPSPIGTPAKTIEISESIQVDAPSVMLSTPPPKTSFRADAPTFVPTDPFPSPAVKTPTTPTKGAAGRINLFECLSANSPTAKPQTSPSGTPDRINLFECLSNEWSTPQKPTQANVDFIESRSKLLRIRTYMEAELKEIPEFKLSTVPATQVELEQETAKGRDDALGASDSPSGDPASAELDNDSGDSPSRRQRGARNKGTGAATAATGQPQNNGEGGGAKGGGKVASRSRIRANAAAARAAASA